MRQLTELFAQEQESVSFQGTKGPVWVVRSRGLSDGAKGASSLEKSTVAKVRDLAGSIVPSAAGQKLEALNVEMHGLTLAEERAVATGMEMASYSYQENRPVAPKARRSLPDVRFKVASAEFAKFDREAGIELGFAVNVARHFTNIPGGDLNPRSYAEAVQKIFAKIPTVSVEVWDGEKLEAEKMGLLLAVGRAAAEGPRFVQIRYRPKIEKGAKALSPLALVGKGITFDSGGLDIKPSSGMRWMKKDMGGSAAVVGLMLWAARTGLPMPMDGYLSLAENAVGAGAFRPGDVVIARNGKAVEISNTDAEGRLVLADALDFAVDKDDSEKPRMVINLATLTGAIKVALGADVAGLFSNNDDLADALFEAGLNVGDPMWRMPLVQAYRSQLKSTFGDFSNCSEGGFGGAITAALFLQSFVRDVPWAHLDIYAWKDGASGACCEAGGSGQGVLALAEALRKLAAESAT
jgi:leucyl aminopeptidase